MKTFRLPVVAVVAAACCLLLLAPASAAPAEDAAAATTTAPAGILGAPVGPIGQALEHLVKEAPERVKTLQDNFRKNADSLRDRVRGGIARVIGTGTGSETTTTKTRRPPGPGPHGTGPHTVDGTTATATTTTTTSAPPSAAPAAHKPPTGLELAAPTTPANVPDATTLKPDSRTLIGVPKRCGPGEKLDRQGRCREVYEDADDEQAK